MTTATPAPAPEERYFIGRNGVFATLYDRREKRVVLDNATEAACLRLAGLLLEQTHQYRDLDADSTCCPDGPEFGCPNYLPHGEVTA
jgi:hypothetical protein